nr:MAG TPA: hypothetical protein [Caudoviricetes sp.]
MCMPSYRFPLTRACRASTSACRAPLLRLLRMPTYYSQIWCDECLTLKPLFREQRHRVALAMRPGICKTRARPRAHTHSRPSPDVVRGKDARVVWVVEYMYICGPGHFRCRSRFRTRCRFRPDPSLRFAALRGRVFEPRFEAGPSQAPGSLRPCGVRVKGAAALGRRSPTRPRRFLAPGGEAFLGSPCRGSLRCAALGRHARPSGLSATSGSDAGQRRSASPPHLDAVPLHLRAGERAAHASQRPCKRF